MQQVFVFVVCGGQEHIDTLNFSLQYLRHFSKKPIWVVTDSRRNEGAIEHTDIVDVETPSEMDNHQASIYLKTGLHKFLPKGNTYCYLDTDIMALDEQADDIFSQYIPPITFAPDHCVLKYFSASALHCTCVKEHQEISDRIHDLLAKHDQNFNLKRTKAQDRLRMELNNLNKDRRRKIWYFFKYYLSGSTYNLRGFTFHKKKKYWTDDSGQIILHDVDWQRILRIIKEQLNFDYDRIKQAWMFPDGTYLNTYCKHLPEQIAKDFGVAVKDQDWQHWNGGVFLFDDQSHDFLEAWHQKCLFVFKSPDWKTRDQGALIATVWEFGLENHPTLSKAWNFIVDANNVNLVLDEPTHTFSDDAMHTSYRPHLVHVYHDFGKTGWYIWDWIEQLGVNNGFKPYSHFQKEDSNTSSV